MKTRSLKDALQIAPEKDRGDPIRETFRRRDNITEHAGLQMWPRLTSQTELSLREITTRFSDSGKWLAEFEASDENCWAHLSRSVIAEQLRDRVRDPFVINQQDSHLCGPSAIIFELARRRPKRYLGWADELLSHGRLTTLKGDTIVAEAELREEPTTRLAEADWLIAASLRDDANLWEDVDDTATGLEGLTWPSNMRYWTRHVLGLTVGWKSCFFDGELEALRLGQDALNRGGVAFLLIDAYLIKQRTGDSEEQAWYRFRGHSADPKVKDPAWGEWTHSRDDGSTSTPDHWVVLLAMVEDGDWVRLRLWSWSGEYHVKATKDSIGEYLYWVVTGG